MGRKLGPFDTVGISGREYNKIVDENKAIRAELAALKEAVMPVVAWAKQRMYGIDLPGWNHPGAESTVYLTSAQLDALAALVGEGGNKKEYHL